MHDPVSCDALTGDSNPGFAANHWSKLASNPMAHWVAGFRVPFSLLHPECAALHEFTQGTPKQPERTQRRTGVRVAGFRVPFFFPSGVQIGLLKGISSEARRDGTRLMILCFKRRVWRPLLAEFESPRLQKTVSIYVPGANFSCIR